jgi:predicted nuclease with RNAse H fold
MAAMVAVLETKPDTSPDKGMPRRAPNRRKAIIHDVCRVDTSEAFLEGAAHVAPTASGLQARHRAKIE